MDVLIESIGDRPLNKQSTVPLFRVRICNGGKAPFVWKKEAWNEATKECMAWD